MDEGDNSDEQDDLQFKNSGKTVYRLRDFGLAVNSLKPGRKKGVTKWNKPPRQVDHKKIPNFKRHPRNKSGSHTSALQKLFKEEKQKSSFNSLASSFGRKKQK